MVFSILDVNLTIGAQCARVFRPDASIGSLTCYVLRAINSFTFCSELFPPAHPETFGGVTSVLPQNAADNLLT